MSLLVADRLRLPGRLEETSLTLEASTLTCLIGPNGSGKTSLLHAIAGIGAPQGEVRIDGMDPAGLGPRDRQHLLTFLPASREVKWPLTASDLIRLGGEENIASVLDRLELGDFANRRVDRLSTGERARVLIARALAPRPKLLLLDEPVANLDPRWQLRLMAHLRDEAHQSGRAALIAAHDLGLAGAHADRLIIMNRGMVVADGDPQLLDGPEIPAVFGVRRSNESWGLAD
jgi:iron complex transport system ATP-binding protein